MAVIDYPKGGIVTGLTAEQLDTLTALVQLVDTKADQQYVIDQISAIVGSAPAALDTLAEIAAQLGNDESAINALTNAIAGSVRFDIAQSLTSGQKTQVLTNIGAEAAGTATAAINALPAVARSGNFDDLNNKANLLDILLAGLSTATSTAVTAADGIKTAIGKLQAQITNNAALLPPFFDTAWYKSNHYFDAAHPYYSSISPTVGAVGSLYLNKRKILADVTISEISVNVTTASATGMVAFGLYTSDANGLPTTRLVAASASGSTTGVKSSACSIALKKGDVVWDAFLNTVDGIYVNAFTPIFNDGSLNASTNGGVILTRGGQSDLPLDVTALVFNRSTTPKIVRIALKAA